jgi:hypothetical protein
MNYKVRTLRTRCVTADGNSDAYTHERSFLYLLTAFDPSGPKQFDTQSLTTRLRCITTQPITKNLKDVAADSHNSDGLPER